MPNQLLSIPMNELIKSAVLGVVQGLTEFLPVSSSGHLEIAKYLLGDERMASESLMMTVVVHFATALSTIVVFHREVFEIASGLLKFKLNEEFWFTFKVLLSMIPAAVIGVFFESEVEELFEKQLLLIGLMLSVTGVLLLLADRAKVTQKSVGIVDAFVIGISQAIAIMPGISRSGATISTSVLLGIDREKAAQFSFLMVVPLILGKIAMDLLNAWQSGEPFASDREALPLTIGFTAAFVTGLLACTWMIRLVKNAKLSYFSVYCFIVAALVIAEAYFGFFASTSA